LLHARTQIRAAAAAELAGLPTTGSNVFPGRVRPLAKGTAAALFIYSLEEDAAVDAMASSMGKPPVLARPLTLIVEGRVSLGGDVDPEDTLDRIALEVETRLGPSTLGGRLLELALVHTKLEIMAEGDSILGAVSLQYRALYRTAEGAPQTLL